MNLTSIHILLTYKCNLRCDHCFVFGGPRLNGVISIADIRKVLKQAQQLGSIRSIYFEGGEPFLYYPLLLEAVKEASSKGFAVGIVTNAFWARNVEVALEKLRPLAGMVRNLSISSDQYHWSEPIGYRARNACQAAEQLGIPVGKISIAQPDSAGVEHPSGQRPFGESGVMYRGRAALKLAERAQQYPWESFDRCPYEDLINLGRVHLDPDGNVLVCEGILLGNIHQNTLVEIFSQYEPETHPIIGPLLRGGPAELVQTYDLPHEINYADACQMCYLARAALQSRFQDILAPARIYQEVEEQKNLEMAVI